MTRINFITAEGESLQFEAQDGMSVMEVAVAHNVPGIDADCGGACACATCHVYIDPAWVDRLPAKTDLEIKMLEFAISVSPQSRLSCRLSIEPGMDGLLMTVPASQY
ncbi:2Fe-2S ferredoxin [Limnohabitans sp. MMS-10A-160]|jgi:2Fe-2S ferredoxin|uniref:2Fe-2S iron-sulfur cluster-binding protein n=1 Tax=Limnohabitans sp. MMS-10A-160 TaxID=1835766 RepID=UPI000D3A5FBB|nr:2Fe-2S iron-sulfur cluster-binding protein [Limnohabitans sp. MMS-10A-160]PUE22966.1 2Fe-2S ferredoxin [Limnohabitans sp. MMS-10A-160]